MNLREYKIFLVVVTGVLISIVTLPILQRFLVYPQSDSLTEFWILGPEHISENYPDSIAEGESYQIYLGVGNHLGFYGSYVIQVKFRNQTQSAPDRISRMPSNLPPLYNIRMFVENNVSREFPISFSFQYSYEASKSRINFEYLLFNDEILDLSGYSTSWDAEENSFFGNLVFELWLYDEGSDSFTYHERYTDLKFNVTV